MAVASGKKSKGLPGDSVSEKKTNPPGDSRLVKKYKGPADDFSLSKIFVVSLPGIRLNKNVKSHRVTPAEKKSQKITR